MLEILLTDLFHNPLFGFVSSSSRSWICLEIAMIWKAFWMNVSFWMNAIWGIYEIPTNQPTDGQGSYTENKLLICLILILFKLVWPARLVDPSAAGQIYNQDALQCRESLHPGRSKTAATKMLCLLWLLFYAKRPWQITFFVRTIWRIASSTPIAPRSTFFLFISRLFAKQSRRKLLSIRHYLMTYILTFIIK